MKLTEKQVVFLLLLGAGVLFALLAYVSESIYGGADNYEHFNIARFAFQHPENFLHHWGKPLFTLMAAPFAQAGIFGVKIANILAGLLASYFTWRISKKLNYRYSWLSILLTLFTPTYFIMLPTSLTEILFSLMLIISVDLFFDKKYIFSAIIASFLYLSRSEGIFILPFFLLALFLNGQHRAIPFLGTGILVYSAIGYFVFGDFLWLIHQNPYTGAKDIYGSGELLHFILSYEEITGKFLPFLLIGGLIVIALRFYQSIKKRSNMLLHANIILLIICPLVAYVSMHSLLWWMGMGGSLGLTRVIAGVLPLASVISMAGFDYAISWFGKWKRVQQGLVFAGSIVFISSPFTYWHLPLQFDPREKLLHETAEWLKANNYNNKKIVYYDPQLCFYLGKNPWNPEETSWMVPDPDHPDANLKEGEIIVWDAHFGSNEGRTPLKKILAASHLRILNVLRPEEPIRVLGGYDYEIYVFQKTSQKVTRTFAAKEILRLNYEAGTSVVDSVFLTREQSAAGKKSYKLHPEIEFASTLHFRSVDFSNYQVTGQEVEFMFYPVLPLQKDELIFVYSIENKEKSYFYYSYDLVRSKPESGKWNTVRITLPPPEFRNSGDRMKLYIWNKGRLNGYLDDMVFRIIEMNEF